MLDAEVAVECVPSSILSKKNVADCTIWTMDPRWITLQVLSFKIGDLHRNQNPEKVKVSQSTVRLLVDRWNHNLGL